METVKGISRLPPAPPSGAGGRKTTIKGVGWIDGNCKNNKRIYIK
jgi:hypothetical protein